MTPDLAASSRHRDWRTKPTDRFILKWLKLYLAAPLSPGLARLAWLRPWMLTVSSATLGVLAGVLLACRLGPLAAALALIAQVLDGADGQVARLTGRVTREGAFWDSVLDRYVDGAMVLGHCLYLWPAVARMSLGDPLTRETGGAGMVAGSTLVSGPVDAISYSLGSTGPVLLAILGGSALIGSNLISYGTARAGSLGLDLGSPTLVSKGARISLLILAALATAMWNGVSWLALGILAVATQTVVLQRLMRTRPPRQSGSDGGGGTPADADRPQSGRHPIGVIHGRFQIVHRDHVRYLLAGKDRCDQLVVGITRPDPMHTAPEPSDPDREDPLANPLTYYERAVMIRACLRAEGVAEKDLTIVPFPIHDPALYQEYLPLRAVFFLSIYDDWGRTKRERLERIGLRTEVLWERPASEKGIAARTVREALLTGGDWQSLVPDETARLIKEWRIGKRLKTMESSAYAKAADTRMQCGRSESNNDEAGDG